MGEVTNVQKYKSLNLEEATAPEVSACRGQQD